MPSKQRTVAVIGLGTFGTSVALELTRVGDRVLGIDICSKRVSDLADELDATLQADTTDTKALTQCGLESVDAVVIAIGREMDASVPTALNVLELGLSKIWVKSQSATHTKVLQAIGISNIIHPERAFGIRLAHTVHNPLVKDFLAIADETFIVQMAVPHNLINRKLAELKLDAKFSVKCIGLISGSNVTTIDCESTTLLNGQDMLIAGRRPDLRRFADSL